jgi:hypothetical protein
MPIGMVGLGRGSGAGRGRGFGHGSGVIGAGAIPTRMIDCGSPNAAPGR